MDGNGRWAQDRGVARPIGHREGSESVRRTVRACRRLGVRALTLYAFSEQNWMRPPLEVEALMELLREFLLGEREEMLANGTTAAARGHLLQLIDSIRVRSQPRIRS
jgi:undecaprenyl diphosphate synthase